MKLANEIHRVLSGEGNPFLWGMDTSDLQRIADNLEEDVREELTWRLGDGDKLGNPDEASDNDIARAFFICLMRILHIDA